jgi:hypothetical protein
MNDDVARGVIVTTHSFIRERRLYPPNERLVKYAANVIHKAIDQFEGAELRGEPLGSSKFVF